MYLHHHTPYNICTSLLPDLPEEVLTEDLGWLFDPQWEALRAQANTLGWLIHPNEVHLGDKIGAGAFGTTYKALWRNKTVAVKCVTVHGETAARMFMREVSLLVSVRHPNVLRCFGTCFFLCVLVYVNVLCLCVCVCVK